nr:HAD hydrolase family protein [Armatimonadota bacterium]NIM22769.1 HAD hydrolase family protein [Armatimonadota bacterium]NIM66603.1 HAD hydrolase family protein [Armatimonadota bacterium]NIM75190.1 HAD hydrolase family protein [Armatimonadota bacterium]NIN04826.1 HAD hydrolase family protein [Armatimonadota bacterium]
MDNAQTRLAKIKTLVLDTDGVLTDGSLLYLEDGQPLVRFSIQDGLGIVAARLVGLEVAIVSARLTAALARRGEELGIKEIVRGAADKGQALQELAKRRQWDLSEVAYMGDDLNDLPPMQIAGAALAPANAVNDVKKAAHWISIRTGGNGAVREAVEAILSAQGRWEQAIQAYLNH